MRVYIVQEQNNEIVKIVSNREKAIEYFEKGYIVSCYEVEDDHTQPREATVELCGKKGGKNMIRDTHPLAGKTVILKCKPDPDYLNGQKFTVEDWQINVFGKSWMLCDGNPAAIKYAMRSLLAGPPIDDEVVYGKVGSFGHIVHVSELGKVVKT